MLTTDSLPEYRANPVYGGAASYRELVAIKVIVWFNSVGPKKLLPGFAGLERA